MKKILVTIGLVIALLLTIFFVREYLIRDYFYNDKKIYDNHEYVKYQGGQEASYFFEKYSMKDDYNNYDFYFLSGADSWRFYHFADAVYSLVYSFDSEQYDDNVEEINNYVKFINYDLRDDTNNDLLACGSTIIGSHIFNTVYEPLFDYPGSFGVIGFNDKEKIISFNYFYNPSLDYFYSKKDFNNYISKNLIWL